jgi:hypothetical protein
MPIDGDDLVVKVTADIVAKRVFCRYLSFRSLQGFPIFFSSRIYLKDASWGAIFIYVRQSHLSASIELWSSASSLFLESEGAEYFLFKEHKYRALVNVKNVVDDLHLETWFKIAVQRIYLERVKMFCGVANKFVVLHQWMDHTDSGIFD